MNGKITFGIITDGKAPHLLTDALYSIRRECPSDDAQIIVVGGDGSVIYPFLHVDHIPFVEREKAWITFKKNLITENAKCESEAIVYMHDYVALQPGWYSGFEKFCNKNPEWDVCMNRINNTDGERYRDWVIWDDPEYHHPVTRTALPPYTYDKTQYLYVSGAYWIAKKYVMQDLPLNEKLFWNDGEDVEWSKRMREKYNYVFNPYSTVKLLKYKDVISRRCYRD